MCGGGGAGWDWGINSLIILRLFLVTSIIGQGHPFTLLEGGQRISSSSRQQRVHISTQ